MWLFLTDLNVIWPDVERCHQALQEVSDPPEVGATDAPGTIHQQHHVCSCIAVALVRFPLRRPWTQNKTQKLRFHALLSSLCVKYFQTITCLYPNR